MKNRKKVFSYKDASVVHGLGRCSSVYEGNSDLTGSANVQVADLEVFLVGEQQSYLIAD